MRLFYQKLLRAAIIIIVVTFFPACKTTNQYYAALKEVEAHYQKIEEVQEETLNEARGAVYATSLSLEVEEPNIEVAKKLNNRALLLLGLPDYPAALSWEEITKDFLSEEERRVARAESTLIKKDKAEQSRNKRLSRLNEQAGWLDDDLNAVAFSNAEDISFQQRGAWHTRLWRWAVTSSGVSGAIMLFLLFPVALILFIILFMIVVKSAPSIGRAFGLTPSNVVEDLVESIDDVRYTAANRPDKAIELDVINTKLKEHRQKANKRTVDYYRGKSKVKSS